MTAVAFDLEGGRQRYARAVRRELISAPLDSRARTVIRLPPLGLDYATHIAQNPKDGRSLAIATSRRHVYITNDGGSKRRQIAKDGDLPNRHGLRGFLAYAQEPSLPTAVWLAV